MSFDILVFSVPVPATTLDGERLIGRLGTAPGTGAQGPDQKITDFHRDLLARFPALESFSDADFEDADERDDIVWSVTPAAEATRVHMAIIWPRASAVLTIVRDLAARHGLACYDPQARQICNPPSLHSSRRPRLLACDGSVVISPGPADIARMLHRLSKRNWYAILESGPDSGWYVQVGVGPDAGKVPPGKFAVEHRDGSPGRHFQCTVNSIGDVIEVFSGFASGDEAWKSTLPWAPLTLT